MKNGAPESEVQVSFEDVTVGYGRQPVVTGLTLQIRRGDFLGLVGPNGAGKTTIIRTALGSQKPLEGRVEWPRGKPRFGYVPQRWSIDELFPLIAEEVVLMGRYGLMGAGRRPGKQDVQAAREALEQVRMREHGQQLYRKLSGGQKQRVLIARALTCQPDILVLDEPTNGMDLAAEHSIMELIGELHQTGITVVMVTHLLSLVANAASRIALLDGKGLRIGSVEEILSEKTLQEIYKIPVSIYQVDGSRMIGAKPAP